MTPPDGHVAFDWESSCFAIEQGQSSSAASGVAYAKTRGATTLEPGMCKTFLFVALLSLFCARVKADEIVEVLDVSASCHVVSVSTEMQIISR